jgi:hypothetical protein
LFILLIFCEEYKLWRSSLCSLLKPSAPYSLYVICISVGV